MSALNSSAWYIKYLYGSQYLSRIYNIFIYYKRSLEGIKYNLFNKLYFSFNLFFRVQFKRWEFIDEGGQWC